MTKQEKMKLYKKRQRILIVCIGSVFLLLVVASILLFVTKDNEPIKSGIGDYLVVQSDIGENGMPVDARDDHNAQGFIYFAESEITLKAGERRSVEVVNNTGNQGGYIWESSNVSVAFAEDGNVTAVSEGSCDITVKISGTDLSAKLRVYVKNEIESETRPKASEDENDEGLPIFDGILIANKTYSLPKDYDPGVNQEALDAFYEMQDDASELGLNIYISSDYRSYADQERIYNNYVAEDGAELADTYSSRPGHSDHQTGLAFDLNSIDDSFGLTPESDWVADNAHKYGFIIRFPKGKENVTGYQYEPWHIRYLGKKKAAEVYNSGLALEEFLGIDSKYSD